MRNFTWNRFPIKNLLIDSLLTPDVESTYLILSILESRAATSWYFRGSGQNDCSLLYIPNN